MKSPIEIRRIKNLIRNTHTNAITIHWAYLPLKKDESKSLIILSKRIFPIFLFCCLTVMKHTIGVLSQRYMFPLFAYDDNPNSLVFNTVLY